MSKKSEKQRSQDPNNQATQNSKKEATNETNRTRPAFTSPLYAALRQGSKEAGQALQALPDSIRTVEEPGTLGNPTQAMLTQDIGTTKGYNAILDQYSSRGNGNDKKEKGIER